MNFFDPSARGNETQKCPICGTNLPLSGRYEDYVCDQCINRATDENGIYTNFTSRTQKNEDGTFSVVPASSGICFIDGKKCFFDEAKFGGLVVQLFESVPKEMTSKY